MLDGGWSTAQDGCMSLRAAARFAALSRRRRVLVVVSSLLAVVLLVMGGLRAWHAIEKHARPHASAARPSAVLLVPGYGGNTRSLSALAARIRAGGREATIVRLPGDGTGDLEAQAGVLNRYVNQAIGRGSPSVDVVGYSAGGVVARLWDVEYDGATAARRIITLGTPLHGTRLAAAGAAFAAAACPAACQELVPGSALLTRLQRAPFTGRPAWLSLWTDDDQVVQPADSARLAGAVNVALQNVCPGAVIAHGQLPTAPLVVGIVLHALGTAPLHAPSSAECGSLRALGGAALAPARDAHVVMSLEAKLAHAAARKTAT